MDYVVFNEQEYVRWLNDRGDMTLRLTYPLTNNSVVVDVGGYKGDWTESMLIGYECNIFILEPIKANHDDIVKRFENNTKIIPINIALSNKTQESEICIGGDSSSIFIAGGNREIIQCMDVKDFFEEYELNEVDLFKINIEGSEYGLLERIIELDLHKKIKNLQIQFHRFIEHCDVRRKKIQEALSETHNCTYNYEWIWENWTIK